MYVHISPYLICAGQALRCAEHIEAAAADRQRLLDAIRCGHLAVMAALTEALSGTEGIGAFPDKKAAEHLAFMRGERPDMPGEFTLTFSQLVERAQERGRMRFAERLICTDGEARALAELDRLRGLIDHPKPTYWSIEVRQVVAVLEYLPGLLDRCVAAARHRYQEGADTDVDEALTRVRAALPSVRPK
jgi:hypothetical protein